MDKKLVKPQLHGIIEYLFSTIQMVIPSAIGLNANAAKAYQVMGTVF